MRSDSYFAGYVSDRYISVYRKIGVFFANTGMLGKLFLF